MIGRADFQGWTMILPSLRQLRYLVALSETLHFGRAADDCNVTQSTLSAGIAELERLLGADLVERSRRRVLLTPLGTQTVARARDLLGRAEELVEAVQAAQTPLSGPLRLGVIPTIGPYALAHVLPALAEAYPALSLQLREEQTARVLEHVEEGRIDVGLIALPYDTGSLVVEDLGEEVLYLAVPAGHPFAERPSVAVAALSNEPMLLLEDGHCLRDHALQACGLSGRRRNEAFQATSLPTLMQLVAAGHGLTVLPAMAVETEMRATPGVSLVALDGARPRRGLALAWRATSARSAEFGLFGDLLKTALGGLIAPSGASAPALPFAPDA
jgi:LysR family hydrogen peroxide-inducible transcriptional activator